MIAINVFTKQANSPLPSLRDFQMCMTVVKKAYTETAVALYKTQQLIERGNSSPELNKVFNSLDEAIHSTNEAKQGLEGLISWHLQYSGK